MNNKAYAMDRFFCSIFQQIVYLCKSFNKKRLQESSVVCRLCGVLDVTEYLGEKCAIVHKCDGALM